MHRMFWPALRRPCEKFYESLDKPGSRIELGLACDWSLVTRIQTQNGFRAWRRMYSAQAMWNDYYRNKHNARSGNFRAGIETANERALTEYLVSEMKAAGEYSPKDFILDKKAEEKILDPCPTDAPPLPTDVWSEVTRFGGIECMHLRRVSRLHRANYDMWLMPRFEKEFWRYFEEIISIPVALQWQIHTKCLPSTIVAYLNMLVVEKRLPPTSILRPMMRIFYSLDGIEVDWLKDCPWPRIDLYQYAIEHADAPLARMCLTVLDAPFDYNTPLAEQVSTIYSCIDEEFDRCDINRAIASTLLSTTMTSIVKINLIQCLVRYCGTLARCYMLEFGDFPLLNLHPHLDTIFQTLFLDYFFPTQCSSHEIRATELDAVLRQSTEFAQAVTIPSSSPLYYTLWSAMCATPPYQLLAVSESIMTLHFCICAALDRPNGLADAQFMWQRSEKFRQIIIYATTVHSPLLRTAAQTTPIPYIDFETALEARSRGGSVLPYSHRRVDFVNACTHLITLLTSDVTCMSAVAIAGLFVEARLLMRQRAPENDRRYTTIAERPPLYHAIVEEIKQLPRHTVNAFHALIVNNPDKPPRHSMTLHLLLLLIEDDPKHAMLLSSIDILYCPREFTKEWAIELKYWIFKNTHRLLEEVLALLQFNQVRPVLVNVLSMTRYPPDFKPPPNRGDNETEVEYATQRILEWWNYHVSLTGTWYTCTEQDRPRHILNIDEEEDAKSKKNTTKKKKKKKKKAGETKQKKRNPKPPK